MRDEAASGEGGGPDPRLLLLFLDANVLFTAAHNPGGKAAFVVEAALRGCWNVVSSGVAAEVACHNVGRKLPHALSALELLLTAVPLVPESARAQHPIGLPENDGFILAAACACGATHFLTGDLAHFGPLMDQRELTGGIVVQTVGDFLRKVAEWRVPRS